MICAKERKKKYSWAISINKKLSTWLGEWTRVIMTVYFKKLNRQNNKKETKKITVEVTKGFWDMWLSDLSIIWGTNTQWPRALQSLWICYCSGSWMVGGNGVSASWYHLHKIMSYSCSFPSPKRHLPMYLFR